MRKPEYNIKELKGTIYKFINAHVHNGKECRYKS